MSKTGFRPETDGFAFVNSWQYDEQEKTEIRELLQVGLQSTREVLRHLPGGPLLLFVLGDLRSEVTTWVNDALVEPYGLCGGMAFAAADYFRSDTHIPRGAQNDRPTRDTPEGKALRQYIRGRLLDSLLLNGVTFLAWMANLHGLADWGPLRGGPGWLRNESQKHWRLLKQHIDGGNPWPIGLVGETRDPTLNHQVLAYGYEDSSDGTGTIYVYDMNCPGEEQTLALDFRGEALTAKEDCGSSKRGGLRGFFCEAYLPEPEPPAIDWP